MAEIMKLDKFVDRYKTVLTDEMEMLLNMKPGEHTLIERAGLKIVFVRVTKFHMTQMYLAEFNGEK